MADVSPGEAERGEPAATAAERLSLVAVYEHVEHAYAARRDLVARGIDPAPLLLVRRDDGPEAGTDAMMAGEGYGASTLPDDNTNDPPEGREGIGSAVTVGASIGGTVGLLATTWIVPGVGAALPGVAPLASTLAGAGLGALLGGAVQGSVHESDATRNPGQARLGGVLLVVRVERAVADAARRLLERYEPLEVRVL